LGSCGTKRDSVTVKIRPVAKAGITAPASVGGGSTPVTINVSDASTAPAGGGAYTRTWNVTGSGVTVTQPSDPTAANASFTATGTGSVTVRLITNVANGCSDTATVTIMLTVSNEQLKLNGASVSVYPNPSTDVFTLDIKGQTGKTNISVMDLVGREILNEVVINNDRLTRQLNLNDQPAGVYLLRISSESGVVTQRLVKE